ncbi:hypothetical protein [Halohasta salina]|nr:hypothetical protein [Halohasta salina]
MSPQRQDPDPVEDRLEAALSAAENSQVKYHIREALQLTDEYR